MMKRNDQEVIDAMTKVFLDAFKEASQDTGVPEEVICQQVFDEFGKRAEDTKRLKEACAEIEGKK